jgi:hypothetical protein
MGGAIINHLIFCLLQRPVIGNVVKQSQFLNRLKNIMRERSGSIRSQIFN